MRTLPLLGLLFAVAALPAQDLHRGLAAADAVIVGRALGKTAHGTDLDLHRVQVLDELRGANGARAVTVLDWPNLGLHQRPVIRQSRLYCLQDASTTATKLGLPAADGPYYKLVGFPGCSPLVGADLAQDPFVQFARLLARAEAGARPTDTASELARIAVEGAPVVRTEAAKLLTGRGDLRGLLVPLQWSRLLARAGGEMDDVPHKIALAELCAEQRLDGVLDTLAVSLGPVQDADYARTVGRIGKLLHGEEATARLQQRLQQLREAKDRAIVLLAIGATRTESALQLLQQLHANDTTDAAVDAALREHRSVRAKAAAAPK